MGAVVVILIDTVEQDGIEALIAALPAVIKLGLGSGRQVAVVLAGVGRIFEETAELAGNMARPLCSDDGRLQQCRSENKAGQCVLQGGAQYCREYIRHA